jgi:HAD superfamily hydrolase (TIGR01509 family)
MIRKRPIKNLMSRKVTPWAIQSVVFDLDGLLIDSEPIFVEAARRLLARRQKTFEPHVIQAMMGTPAANALALFREHYQLPESVEELAGESSRLFYEVLGKQAVRVMSGVFDLLRLLEQHRIPKAIATSSSRRYAHFILAPHGLIDRFDFVLTCDDVRAGKPSPEIYEKAAARFGHAAETMLVLEDSPNGLRAAKAAGACCIVVPHATVPTDQLEGADAVVGSLADPALLEILGV